MKTQELKELLTQTEAAKKAAWKKYQAAEQSIQPFKKEWESLYEKHDNLKMRLSVMEEIERESEIQGENEAA